MNHVTDDLPNMAEREEIVARLCQISSAQKLIERACALYAEWYQIEPKGLPHPLAVQITFQLQMLYFSGRKPYFCGARTSHCETMLRCLGQGTGASDVE